MIDFNLLTMNARQILAYLKSQNVGLDQIPNINATEKTYRNREAVKDALKEYQVWLAENSNPEEVQIPEE
jgi:hypothetical protein